MGSTTEALHDGLYKPCYAIAENWRRSQNRAQSSRKNGGRDLVKGLGEPLPRKFVKNRTLNNSFWCIFEANILK